MSVRYSQVDARGAIFNDIGRDLFNIHSYNVFLTLGTLSSYTMDPTLPILHRTQHEEAILTPIYHLTPDLSDSIATHLIDEILQLLIVPIDVTDQCHDLTKELKILLKILARADLSIQAYEHTPLGPILANTINKVTGRCLGVLQALLQTINGYQRDLHSTDGHNFSNDALWSCDRLAWFRNQLPACQRLLSECLLMLDSYIFSFVPKVQSLKQCVKQKTWSNSWQEVGNRLCVGSMSIHEFSAFLQQGLLPLHHVQLSKIIVLDHLGQNILVPTMFCSAWKVHCGFPSHPVAHPSYLQ